MKTSADLCRETGATYRQIDYWVRNDVIKVENPEVSGSGTSRQFDDSVVDKLKVVTIISKAFGGKGVDTKTLKKIVDTYDSGEFMLGDGVFLTWATWP